MIVMTPMVTDEQLAEHAGATTAGLERWLDMKEGRSFTAYREAEYSGPDWPLHGLCRDATGGDWIDLNDRPRIRDRPLRARKQFELAMCAVCPVKVPCLNFALDTDQTEGIWGGTLPRDRL